VTLEVDADDADASGFEPIWADKRRVGFVTSGGYGHTVSKSLAMGYLDRESSPSERSSKFTLLARNAAVRSLQPLPMTLPASACAPERTVRSDLMGRCGQTMIRAHTEGCIALNFTDSRAAPRFPVPCGRPVDHYSSALEHLSP